MENYCTTDEYLLSLLKIPLISSEENSTSSDDEGPIFPQVSFQEIFDDAAIEPLSFRSHIPSTKPEPVPYQSSSHSQLKQGLDNFGLGNSLVSFLFDPINSIVQTKRSSDQLLSDIYTPSQSKRQRKSPQASSDETPGRSRMSPQDRQWRAMFDKLTQYKIENGHCCVPHSYRGDPILARWVKRQRYQYKRFQGNNPASAMTAYRIEQLNSIGFVWHSHEWQTKLNELKAFKQNNGHCNVPSNYPTNPLLAAWIACQRSHYRLWISGCNSSTMTAQRYEILVSLGFDFCEDHQCM